MKDVLLAIFIFLIVQRLGELYLARSNRKWMMKRGAKEIGEGHYFLFVLLHSLFFLSIALEYFATPYHETSLMYFALSAFIALQVLRIWCISTLGRRWNTRILVLPDEQPIKKGLYKYIKHPNYIIVFLELGIIPVMFHAYTTALLFPFLHVLVLTVRIPAEERALDERL